MSGVQFDRKSAERVAAATKRVEATPYGGQVARRDSAAARPVAFFVLVDALAAASDSLTGAAAARATFYTADPSNPPVVAEDKSTYTAQELVTSGTPRVEWVVNRSLDLAANADSAGMAIMINGEWLVFWVDCTAGD